MVTRVVPKLVGTGGDYSSLTTGWADWEAARPSDHTASRANTTQTGSTSSTIKLDAAASASNNFYVGHTVLCDARPTEIRLITAYDGTTKVATVGAYRDPTTEVASSATWANTPGVEAYTIDPVIWSGRQTNCAMTSTGTMVDITGCTVDGNNYAEMTTAIGASFVDNASFSTNAYRWNSSNGASISGNYNHGPVIMNREAPTRASKLQIKGTGSGAAAQCIDSGATAGGLYGCQWDRLIIEGTSTGQYGVMSMLGAQNLTNSLVIKTAGAATAIMGVNNSAQIINSVLANISGNSMVGCNGNHSSYTLKNAGFFGVTAVKGGSSNATVTGCASDGTGATITTAFSISTGAKFQNITAGTHDFRVQSGSSLLAVCTADTTLAPVSVNGVTRPTGAGAADIGPWQTAQPSALTGSVTLDDIVASGSLSSIPSSLTGGITLDDIIAAGSLGQAPGVLVTTAFKNWSGAVLASAVIPKVAVLRVSDMSLVYSATNVSTDASGIMTITNIALVAGTQYLLVTCNAGGTAFGCAPFTAT